MNLYELQRRHNKVKKKSIIVLQHEFDMIVKEHNLREALENVFVNEDGTYIVEVRDRNTVDGDTFVYYFERTTCINNAGYVQVGCKGSVAPVHRLVAFAWLDKPSPDCTEVDHIDGNKQNNHYSNLEWVTHSTNMRRAYDKGQVSYAHKQYGRYVNGYLFKTDGTKTKMTFAEYIGWRAEQNLPIRKMIKLHSEKGEE